jgi:hypothetical protein
MLIRCSLEIKSLIIRTIYHISRIVQKVILGVKEIMDKEIKTAIFRFLWENEMESNCAWVLDSYRCKKWIVKYPELYNSDELRNLWGS